MSGETESVLHFLAILVEEFELYFLKVHLKLNYCSVEFAVVVVLILKANLVAVIIS